MEVIVPPPQKHTHTHAYLSVPIKLLRLIALATPVIWVTCCLTSFSRFQCVHKECGNNKLWMLERNTCLRNLNKTYHDLEIRVWITLWRLCTGSFAWLLDMFPLLHLNLKDIVAKLVIKNKKGFYWRKKKTHLKKKEKDYGSLNLGRNLFKDERSSVASACAGPRNHLKWYNYFNSYASGRYQTYLKALLLFPRQNLPRLITRRADLTLILARHFSTPNLLLRGLCETLWKKKYGKIKK